MGLFDWLFNSQNNRQEPERPKQNKVLPNGDVILPDGYLLKNRCGTGEIAGYVNEHYGTHITSTHQMNLILEKMGFIRHVGNIWMTTEKGAPYSTVGKPGGTAGNFTWYTNEIGEAVGQYIMNDPELRNKYC